MEQHGLKRGVNGLRLNMMCEIPSNALLAEQFLEYFDGFSIGSNDMTQLALGLDRDSGLVAATFDERNPAVKALLSMAIRACRCLLYTSQFIVCKSFGYAGKEIAGQRKKGYQAGNELLRILVVPTARSGVVPSTSKERHRQHAAK